MPPIHQHRPAEGREAGSVTPGLTEEEDEGGDGSEKTQ